MNKREQDRECMRRWRANPENREKERKRKLAAYQKNRRKEIARTQAWREANREKFVASRKTKDARAKRREWEREYRKKNIDKCREKCRKYREAHRERYRELLNNWNRTDRGIAYRIFNGATRHARVKGIDFSISLEWIIERIAARKCERSGIPFVVGKGIHPFSPSIDRIDSSKGYTPGNVQIVVWMYNRAKGKDSDADVLAFAKALISNGVSDE